MKLLLDTTYLLPAMGVAVRNIPPTVMRDLRGRRHDISICTITIFELAAKGAKLVRDGKLNENRVREGIQAILNDEAVRQVQFQDPDVLARAMSIRTELDDFIDCLILSSAATAADALVSEDEEIQDIVSRENFRAKLKPTNAAFDVYPSRKAP
jgi:PIN domain nuclease of toxin-antitoxin system